MNFNRILRPPSSGLTNLILVCPLRTLVVCALVALSSPTLCAQDPPSTADPTLEIVSGTITELADDRIVVNRAVLGKPPENRVFLRNGDTKVEGQLKVNARVTVGFKTTEDGDVAVRIIVRPPQQSKDQKEK
jgi:hypothetical protein